MGAIGNKDNNGNFHFFTGVSIPEGLQMDLLWENSSPSSAFAAQTVTISRLNTYKIYYISFSTGSQSAIAKIGDGCNAMYWNRDYTGAQYWRIISSSIENNSITFDNCYRIDKLLDNTTLIPLKIYGIK